MKKNILPTSELELRKPKFYSTRLPYSLADICIPWKVRLEQMSSSSIPSLQSTTVCSEFAYSLAPLSAEKSFC